MCNSSPSFDPPLPLICPLPVHRPSLRGSLLPQARPRYPPRLQVAAFQAAIAKAGIEEDAALDLGRKLRGEDAGGRTPLISESECMRPR